MEIWASWEAGHSVGIVQIPLQELLLPAFYGPQAALTLLPLGAATWSAGPATTSQKLLGVHSVWRAPFVRFQARLHARTYRRRCPRPEGFHLLVWRTTAICGPASFQPADQSPIPEFFPGLLPCSDHPKSEVLGYLEDSCRCAAIGPAETQDDSLRRLRWLPIEGQVFSYRSSPVTTRCPVKPGLAILVKGSGLLLSSRVAERKTKRFGPWQKRRMTMIRRAVFLDKDGTLVENVPFNVDPDKIRILPGVVEGLGLLQGAGYCLIVVSNQSGVARGFFPESALEAVQARLRQELGACGVVLDGWYFCPHHPEGVVAPLAIECQCRKPKPGLLLQAAKELGLDLERSWMIGDLGSDVQAGQEAGCRTVWLVPAERPREVASPRADCITWDLAQAARFILEQDTRAAERQQSAQTGSSR